MQKSAQRAAELTSRILAYVGKGKLVVRSVNLSKLIEDMTHLLAASISKMANVVYHLAENLVHTENAVQDDCRSG